MVPLGEGILLPRLQHRKPAWVFSHWIHDCNTSFSQNFQPAGLPCKFCQSHNPTTWVNFIKKVSFSYIGEGNGNPLQYSCLENSVDRGAWRAAVHWVTQSQTRLKWLSMLSLMYICVYIHIYVYTYIHIYHVHISFYMFYYMLHIYYSIYPFYWFYRSRELQHFSSKLTSESLPW